MKYFIDWFRVDCENCGLSIHYPLSDFDNHGLSMKLARQIHDRNNKGRKCDDKYLTVILLQNDDKVEL